MAMCHGHRYGEGLTGIVFVDTALRPARETQAHPVQAYTKPTRYYSDKQTLMQRFRLGPSQPCENEYLLHFIAAHSVVEREQGWTWKFDVASRGADHHTEPLADYVRELPCRKALIYGANSAMVTPEVVPFLTSLFEKTEPVICLPEAHHHLFLDQPLAFVVALRAILSGWR